MPLKVQKRGNQSAVPKNGNPAAKAAGSALPFGLPEPPAGTKQLPAGISLCMIVKDEERFLEQCLRSINDAVDEICIVDTGSTDRTVEIAESFGARVEVHEWRDDFAWARNKAIDMAKFRWVVMLDADEEVVPETLSSLAALRNAPAGLTGLYLRCENLSDDYKGTGSMSHLLARIFPNNPRIRYVSPIHEFISIDGGTAGIDTRLSDIRILHHGYLADVVADRNKAERNLDIIRRATEEHPEDPFHWYNLGMTAHVIREFETAISALEKMRAILGKQARGFLPQALVTLAECYQEARDDYEKAHELVLECLKNSPHLSNAHFALGRILMKLGRREEARQAFLDAIEDAKHRDIQFVVDDQVYLWKAQLCLGVSYAEDKDYDRAIEWYDRGLANQPNVQPLLFNRSHALEGAGRYGEAEKSFRETAEHFDDEDSIVQYVNYLFRRNERVRAFEVMNQTVDRVSKRCAATFFVAAAQLSQKLGNTMDELQYLQLALKYDPSCGPVLDALEAYYTARGDQAMLEELRAREFEHEPKLAPDFVRRSFRLLGLKRYAEAARYAEDGLRLLPLDPELRYNAASAYVNLNEPSKALEHLAIIAPGPSEVAEKALRLRAILQLDRGNYPEAIDALEGILRFKPVDVDALILKAQTFEKSGDPAKAVETLEGSLALDPQRVAVELASLYLRGGRFADAQRVAETALTQ